jgi:hypothetical protein
MKQVKNKELLEAELAERELKKMLSELKFDKIRLNPKRVQLKSSQNKKINGFSDKINKLINQEQVFSKFDYVEKEKIHKIGKILKIMENEVDRKRQQEQEDGEHAPKQSKGSNLTQPKRFNEYGSNRNIRSKSRQNEEYNSLRSKSSSF